MKPHLLLLFLLVACTAKQEKDTSVLFATEEAEADTLQYYDLHEIQSSGTIIAGTLSGPDTYYEYHGNGMGLQYRLAEAFAQSIGVVLQMEISPDTTSLLQKLKQGEIDFIALEMPTWQTREDEPLLRGAITEWWKPDRVKQIESTANNTTVTVRRRMRPVMQDASHGIISAFDDLFRRYSSTAGWDWRLLAAQSYQESSFDPQAISYMGAMGLMQLMPGTAREVGVSQANVFDPQSNVAGGVRYINRLNTHYSFIADADERINFILAAYNAGAGHVDDARALAKKYGKNPNVWLGNVDAFVLKMSEAVYYNQPEVKHGYFRGSETYDYVNSIRTRWNEYKTKIKR